MQGLIESMLVNIELLQTQLNQYDISSHFCYIQHIQLSSSFHHTSACTSLTLSIYRRNYYGCSSVIQYSRNLIWPRSIFFIFNVWCWFSYGMLINSNNVWIWGIIQICKTFARILQISFLLYMCYSFLTMTKSLGCTCTKRSFGKASKSYSLRGVSGFSKSAWRIP